MKKPAFISRNILLLGLVSFFTDMSSEMLYPVMPLFFQSAGLSIIGIGLIEGAAEAVAGTTKSFFGHLGDKLGRPEWFVRLGYSLSAFTKPLLGIVSGTGAFIAIRSADRFGKGIRTAPRDAILASESAGAVRGRVFGFHRSLDTLGAAIGPLIALGLIATLDLYNSLGKIFLYSLIPGLAAVTLTFMVKTKKTRTLVSRQVFRGALKSYPSIFRPSLYTPKYKKLLVGMMLVGILNSSDVFILLRASELIGSQQTILGMTLNNTFLVIGLYIVYNISYAILSLVTGFTADKYGFRNTFVSGLLAFAIAYGMLGRSLSLVGLVVAFCVYGLFSAVNDAVVKAWLSKQLPREQAGTGIGVANTVISITFLFSSLITAFIWARYSSGVALSLLSIGMIIPITYMLLVIPDEQTT